jgi:hypothetical protein
MAKRSCHALPGATVFARNNSMKQKLKRVYVALAVIAALAGSAAAVSCHNEGWEKVLDIVTEVHTGGIGAGESSQMVDGRLFIKQGAAKFSVALDNERSIAMRVKANGIKPDGTPLDPEDISFLTPGGVQLNPADKGFFYLPKPAQSVVIEITTDTAPADLGMYRLTLETMAGDWGMPFEPRIISAECRDSTKFPVVAKLNGVYYANLQAAVTAAAAGTPTAPDVITVLADIPMASGGNVTVPSGKYIRLVSGGGRRIIKRVAGNTANPLFTVDSGGQLTLENIIVDGGAVWTGGTANPPSPAFGASNTGMDAVTASNTLIFASGAGAKLTFGAGAVARNNYISNGNQAGGGIRADTGAEVIINGGEVCYNQSSYTGGGIALGHAGTKLTLISGSINNNKSSPYDGGGVNAEGGNVYIEGGSITKNHATTNGGGINVNMGTAGHTMTISGGEISGNAAVQKGGGIKAGRNYTVTMSGGVISGNTAGTTGNGVHVGDNAEPTVFKMSGGARIAPNNNVYLLSGKTIEITGTLTGTRPVAVIKPEDTAGGAHILSPENSALVSSNYLKFVLDPSVTGRVINSSGNLSPTP